MPSLFWKMAVIVAPLLIVGYVEFSRIFMSGYYLTDVLAGYAGGIAWSGLGYTFLEKFSR